MRLYDYSPSGNGYKVRLLLSLLDLPYEFVEIDIRRGQSRTPEFLKLNPNGRVPVLEIDDGIHLSESNAILTFLAEQTRYFPNKPISRATVMQWLFFEQYSHEPHIAVARSWHIHNELDEEKQCMLRKHHSLGHAALRVMEKHLENRSFFVDEQYTIADISLYAYSHTAEEGGFDLNGYPSILSWLDNVRKQPRHISINQK